LGSGIQRKFSFSRITTTTTTKKKKKNDRKMFTSSSQQTPTTKQLERAIDEIYAIIDDRTKTEKAFELASKATKKFPKISLFAVLKALALMRMDGDRAYEDAGEICEDVLGRFQGERDFESSFGTTKEQSLRALMIFYQQVQDRKFLK